MGQQAQDRAQATAGLPPPPPPPPYYSPFPPYETTHHHYVLLPTHPPHLPYYSSSSHRNRRRYSRCCDRCLSTTTTTLLLLLLLAASAFFLWPSRPLLQVVRVHLNHVSVSPKKFPPSSLFPVVSVDISMDATLRVRNTDFFSLDYDSLVVWIGYRGRKLGNVRSDGGRVRARGISYVNATINLDGIAVLHDALRLLEDLARGSIPLDSLTEFQGHLQFPFFRLPLEAKISCVVYVDTNNETVISQDCYPE